MSGNNVFLWATKKSDVSCQPEHPVNMLRHDTTLRGVETDQTLSFDQFDQSICSNLGTNN